MLCIMLARSVPPRMYRVARLLNQKHLNSEWGVLIPELKLEHVMA